MKPFSPRTCTHRVRLTLLGRQVLLAADDRRVAEILAEAFGSRAFAPASGEASTVFSCSIHCDPPWSFVMEFPHMTLLGRTAPDRPSTHDLYRWSEKEITPAGSSSYEGSQDLSTVPSKEEIVAAYFQRRALDALLKKESSLRIIHGGSLACNGAGVLLLAESRGGKSTLSLACTLEGMRFLSDDHTVIDLDGAVIHPFPRALRLRQGTCEMVPEFAALCTGTEVDPAGETRYFLNPETLRPDALGEPLRLTHVVRMRGFAVRPRIVPAAPSAMAVSCAESDFFPAPDGMLELLWRWGSLVNDMACADLHVGHPRETAVRLRSFLERGEHDGE